MNAIEKRLLEINDKAVAYGRFSSELSYYYHDMNPSEYSFAHCYDGDLYAVMARMHLAFLQAMAKEYHLDYAVNMRTDSYYANGKWKETGTNKALFMEGDMDSFGPWDFDNEYNNYQTEIEYLMYSFSPYAACKTYPLYMEYSEAVEMTCIEQGLDESEREEFDEESPENQALIQRYAYEELTEGFFDEELTAEHMIMESIDMTGDWYQDVVCGKNTLIPHFMKWYRKQRKDAFAQRLVSIIEDDLISPNNLNLYGEYISEQTNTAHYCGGIVGSSGDTGDCLCSENYNPAFIVQQSMICESILYLDDKYHFLPDKKTLRITHSDWRPVELRKAVTTQKTPSDSLLDELGA